MYALSKEDLAVWLDRYGQAWIAGDAHIIPELYATDAEYYETPFKDHFLGLPAIQNYWDRGAGSSQKEVTFTYNILSVDVNIGLAQFWATFVRIPSGNYVELDGIMQVEFNDEGKCRVFREWWHRRETSEQGMAAT